MLSADLHVVLASAMLLCGAVGAWLMLEAFGGRVPRAKSGRNARVHRWLGRTFLGIFLVLLVSMVRMALELDRLGPIEAVHAALALALLPILVIKVLIARRYEPLQRFLPLIGSLVLVVSFVTVGTGLLAAGAGSRSSAGTGGDSLPDHPGRAPFQQYCSQCHSLDRPLGLARRERPAEATWTGLVGEMRQRAGARGRAVWTPAEGQRIVEFLVAVGQGADPTAGGGAGAGGADDHGRGRGRGRGRGGR